MKKKISLFIFFLNSVIVFSQDQNVFVVGSKQPQKQSETLFKEYPVLWQQTAAEYRALCFQAFNFATHRLKAISGKKNRRCIVTIDVCTACLFRYFELFVIY